MNGEQIREARKKKNLSQEDLAEALGVTRQAVSKWENDSSIPQGINREILAQVLDIPGEEESAGHGASPANEAASLSGERERRGRFLPLFAGIGIGLAIGAAAGIFIGRGQADSAKDEMLPPEEPEILPSINGVKFYDDGQDIVGGEDSWYDLEKIDSILVSWAGGTPENIRLFYTPIGTDTGQRAELLLTEPAMEGDSDALINADALRQKGEGHAWLELEFGGDVVKTQTYGFFSGSAEASDIKCCYVRHADEESALIDIVEWVTVPGRRAAELGIENESGFFVYNEEERWETYPLAKDCRYTLLDWQGNYERIDATPEEFRDAIAERAKAGSNIPYRYELRDGEIVSLDEQYVP